MIYSAYIITQHCFLPGSLNFGGFFRQFVQLWLFMQPSDSLQPTETPVHTITVN